MTRKYEIDAIGGNCPVEAEGWVMTPKGKHRFYFRARGTSVSMDVTKDPAAGDPLSVADQDGVWSWGFKYGLTYEAGWITEAFALGCIDEAASVFTDQIEQMERMEALAKMAEAQARYGEKGVTDLIKQMEAQIKMAEARYIRNM